MPLLIHQNFGNSLRPGSGGKSIAHTHTHARTLTHITEKGLYFLLDGIALNGELEGTGALTVRTEHTRRCTPALVTAQVLLCVAHHQLPKRAHTSAQYRTLL